MRVSIAAVVAVVAVMKSSPVVVVATEVRGASVVVAGTAVLVGGAVLDCANGTGPSMNYTIKMWMIRRFLVIGTQTKKIFTLANHLINFTNL